jgi:hypothetical protein
MIMKRSSLAIIVAFLLVVVFSGAAFGWSIKTHKFIASKAKIDNPEYACCPDICNDESSGVLGPLHWYNAAPGTWISPEYLDQNSEALTLKVYPYLAKSGPIEITSPSSSGNVVDYVISAEPNRLPYLFESEPIEIMVPNASGALYWVILKLYQDLREKKAKGEPVYYSTIAHFVGDLSNPLHNFPHGDSIASDGKYYQAEGAWATGITNIEKGWDRHGDYDRAYEKSFNEIAESAIDPRELKDPRKFEEFRIVYECKEISDKQAFENRTNSVRITTTDDLKKEICRIANSSLRLAEKCYRTKIDMSEREAFEQLILSVSLLKAIKANIETLPAKSK